MNKKFSTSNGEQIPRFQTVKTIQELLQTTTISGSIVLLEDYPVNYRQQEWKLSKGTKIAEHTSNLKEKQGIVILHLQNKFVAYARFGGSIHSLSAQCSWLEFIKTYLRF